MGYNTRIDWCDSTWNPVTGCLHDCEYCYARGIANRFGGDDDGAIHDISSPIFRNDNNRIAPYPFGFAPSLHRHRLNQPKKWSEPRTIFVCSMADLFGEWVPDEWIAEVFKACDEAPQHRYIFLTKNPARLCRMASATKVFLWNVDHSEPHPMTNEYKDVPLLPIRDNWWFGSTLDNAKARRFQGGNMWNTFTSIRKHYEPLSRA